MLVSTYAQFATTTKRSVVHTNTRLAAKRSTIASTTSERDARAYAKLRAADIHFAPCHLSRSASPRYVVRT